MNTIKAISSNWRHNFETLIEYVNDLGLKSLTGLLWNAWDRQRVVSTRLFLFIEHLLSSTQLHLQLQNGVISLFDDHAIRQLLYED